MKCRGAWSGFFFVLPVLALVCDVACSTDLAVPEEAQLECASAADCPSGWTCNQKVGRCVKTENIDSTAPAIVGDVTVTPAMLKKGAKATVSFEVSEDLSTPPVVAVNAGTDRLLTPASSLQPPAYAFTYAAVGDEVQDIESPISIVLTDKSGNESGKLSGGSLKFDFIAPDLVDWAISGSPVNATGTAAVTFTVNETPAVPPAVKLNTGESLTLSGVPFDNRYVFTYSPTGNESEDFAGVGVTIALADEAGNTASKVLDTPIVFDFTLPAIDGTVSIDPPVATAGTSVSVTFSTSEDLDDDPVVTAGGGEIPGERLGARAFKYTYAVTSADAEGGRTIAIALKDPAGNEQTVLDAGNFVVDLTAPKVVAGTLALKEGRTRYSAVTGFDSLEVSFDVDEAPAGMEASVQTAGGPVPLACGAYSGQSPHFTCSYTVTGSEGSGMHAVVVTLLDEARNRGSESREVFFDFSAPKVMSTDVNPPVGRLGGTLVYSATADEPLGAGASPVLSVAGTGAWSSPNVAGTLVTWMHTIGAAASENGTHAVLVSGLCDEVGNCTAGEVQGREVVIDNVMPGIAAAPVVTIDTGYPRAKDGAVVTVNFSANEALISAPEARLGQKTMTCTGTHPDYTCTRTVSAAAGEDDEGVAGIYLVLTDAASNQTTTNVWSLELDFSAPDLVGAEASPNRAKNGVSIAYSVTPNEALSRTPADTPVMTAARQAGTETLAFALRGGTSYIFEHTVSATDSDGTYDVSVTMTDLAGNTATRTGATFEVDASVPQVSNFAIGPAGASAQAGHNVITVQFDSSEAVTADVRVGANQTAPCTATGSAPAIHYTCEYTVQGAPADQEGQNVVSVGARDQFGNQGGQSGGVILDFSPPAVVGTSATPSPAPRGGTITYTLNTSEPMDASHPPVLSVAGVPQWSPASVAQTTAFWTRTVTGEADENGTHAATVTNICDMLGNCLVTHNGTQVNIDNVEPSIVGGPAFNKSPAYYRIDETVTVSFTTNEDLDAALPTATLNTTTPVNMPCVAGGGTNAYTCSPGRNLAATDLPEGQVSVSISLRDAAQNPGFGSAMLTLDYTNPSLVTASPSKAFYKGGDTISYTASVSEPLSGTPGRPTLRVYKDGALQTDYFVNPSSETDTSFAYVKAVTADGTYTVEVDLTDKAGNAVNDAGAPVGWVIDATAPSVTILNPAEGTRLSREDGFKTLLLQFDTANEDFDAVPGGLKVTAGGVDITAGCGPFSASSPNYTCLHVVDGGDTEGVKNVVVAVGDAAGNEAQEGVNVVYDFTPPSVPGVAALSVVPQAGCPLSAQQAPSVSNGTSFKVLFAVSELLKDDKADWVRAALGAQEIVLDYDSGESNQFVLVYNTVAGGLTVQGEHLLSVKLTDLVGNSQTVTPMVTPNIVVDTAAPGAPDVNTADRIVYKRVPWGFDENRDGTFAPKTFRILSGANAVDTDTAWVLAYDGPDPATAAEIGREAAPGGTFGAMELNRADRVDVYVAGYDAACNRGPVAKVRDAEWTATMGYKVPGRTLENPNLFVTAPNFSPALVQDPTAALEPPGSGISQLQRVDADALIRLAEASWQERNRSNLGPSARSSHAMAYDAARGRVVMFGGNDGSYKQDTWEWDSDSGAWADRTPPGTKPSARERHAMAYDAARGRVVLFGGWAGPFTHRQDVWEWDGASGTWTDRTPAGVKPSARIYSAMAYDAARGRVVLFGGHDGSRRDDTWEWNGNTGTWTELTPDGSRPSARNLHAMAYDAARGRVVLFGGSESSGYRQDTWEWDGAARTWTDVTPAGANPSARIAPAMAYDAAQGRVVLFGGNDGSYRQDTWEWDGAAGIWTEVTPAGSKPTARVGHAMAYDAARGKTVIFGGHDGLPTQDVWEWDGASGAWTNRTPAGVRPPARNSHAMAYDAARGKVMLFGGAASGSRIQDTWEWDGAAGIWTEVTPAGSPPPARSEHAMAYDAARGKVVLFGGSTGIPIQDTWEWDGTAATWTDTTPAGDKPTARSGHAMAYDAARGKAVLFGGNDGSYRQDTWEWDGAAGTWTDVTPVGTKPTARSFHAMAYDAARGKVVLFGGWDDSRKQDTWEWDGASGTWTDVTPAGEKPSARSAPAMAYDAGRGKVALFAGYDGSSYTQDTWEWDGASGAWTDVTPAGEKPSGRVSHAMAYDGARGNVVAFGGLGDAFYLDDTWELDGGAFRRPGQLMQAAFGVAGVGATPTWKSAAATFYSGGVGYPAGAPTNGVDLLVWDEGRWKVVATNNDPPGSPQLVSWITTDPQVISRLLFGDQQTLNLAVAPTAPNGTGTGAVSVDYAEVVVKYRQP
jgi:hypothetical protein